MLTRDQRKVLKCFRKDEPLNVTQICSMLKWHDTNKCFEIIRTLYHKEYLNVETDIINLERPIIRQEDSFVISAYGESFRSHKFWQIISAISIVGNIILGFIDIMEKFWNIFQ